jgi:hypothetical protein
MASTTVSLRGITEAIGKVLRVPVNSITVEEAVARCGAFAVVFFNRENRNTLLQHNLKDNHFLPNERNIDYSTRELLNDPDYSSSVMACTTEADRSLYDY